MRNGLHSYVYLAVLGTALAAGSVAAQDAKKPPVGPLPVQVTNTPLEVLVSTPVTIAGTPSVTVAGDVKVKDPALTAWIAEGEGSTVENQQVLSLDVGDPVAPGKRLVIEHVSATCSSTDLDDDITTVNLSVVAGPREYLHRFPVLSKGRTNFAAYFTTAMQGRLYSDGHASKGLRVIVARHSTAGVCRCYATVSGYLVEIPQ